MIVELALHEKCFLQLFASALGSEQNRIPTTCAISTLCSNNDHHVAHTIAAKVGADLSQDHQLKALSEETKPERLIEQIEARENN